MLASVAEEKPNRRKCVFCERLYHSIHTCRQFMDKSIMVNNNKVQFVQAKGLCFGCLDFGHQSKKCEKRSVCDTCKGKHSTCLHEERDKEVKRNKEGDKEQKESKGIKVMKEIKQTKETPNETILHRVVQTNSSNLIDNDKGRRTL